MANQEHLDILKQGRKAWNELRKQYPEVVPDLAEANPTLCLQDFAEADLSRAKPTSSFLPFAKLNGANLSNANLEEANLCLSKLSNANLCSAVLPGTNLLGATLTRADLSRAKLNIATGFAQKSEHTLVVPFLFANTAENTNNTGTPPTFCAKPLQFSQMLISPKQILPSFQRLG